MLTIHNFKKLEGLILKGGLKVIRITDVGDAYSIWLSDNSNIELERKVLNTSNRYPLYRMFIGYRGTAMTEFVTIKTIRTLELMVKQLVYIKEKYTVV